MSGSSDTPRGWEAGGAETNTPKRRKTATKTAKAKTTVGAPKQKAKAEAQAMHRERARAPSAANPPSPDNPLLNAGDSLLLGWRIEEARQQLGFHNGPAPVADAGKPVWLDGEGHLITFARTGSGKGRGALIPNLLTYEGPAIVIDPKGEACHVTARRRREMGQKVHVIDPFGIISAETDSLNPMDAFSIPGVDFSSLAMDIAKLLSGGGKIGKDPFWDIRGHDLAAGVIAGVAAVREPGDRNLVHVRRLLKDGDHLFHLNMLVENSPRKLPAFAREEISNYLGTTDVTRSGIHATACSYFSIIASEAAQRTVSTSTIDLAAVRRGDPMTIYLVVPPTQLASHAPLFRLWTAALMSAVLSRDGNLPKYRTLFAIDECAQLGDFGLLPMVYTLARSYGMRVWAFFQDLAQLRKVIGEDWPTVINNAAAMQVFGVANQLAASDLAKVLGDFTDEGLRNMDPSHLALQVAGQRGVTQRRPDYLLDPAYAGLFDPHPLLGGNPPERQGARALLR